MLKKEMNHNARAASFEDRDDLNEREKNVLNDFDEGNLALSAESGENKYQAEAFPDEKNPPRKDSADSGN